MHSCGWLDQPPFLFGSAKNIEHLALCCVGASAQNHNCSVSARVQMHPRLRPAMCTVLCIIVHRISHLITHVLIQSMGDYFLYLWTEIAENSGISRQFREKSRIIPTECDDMTGLGSFPAGLFLFPREKTIWNSQLQQTEMHPLWTITINRPGYMRIVHHTYK